MIPSPTMTGAFSGCVADARCEIHVVSKVKTALRQAINVRGIGILPMGHGLEAACHMNRAELAFIDLIPALRPERGRYFRRRSRFDVVDLAKPLWSIVLSSELQMDFVRW